MVDYCDPKVINFYSEQYKKEELARLKWFYDNVEMLQNSPLYNNDSSGKTQELVKKFKAEYEKLKNPAKVKKIIRWDSNIAFNSTAIEPDPKIKRLLYKSQSGHGRIAFLKELYKKPPEERFRRPETTNMEYGWDIAKSGHIDRKGRTNIMKKTFFQRTGAVRDPDHYKQAISSYMEAE